MNTRQSRTGKLGYGLGDDHVFAVGQVLNSPVGDDFDPNPVVVELLLPWRGEPNALIVYCDRDRPRPDLPSLTTARFARDWWLPWDEARYA